MVAVQRENVFERKLFVRSCGKWISCGIAVFDPWAECEVWVDAIEYSPNAAKRVIGMIVFSRTDATEPIERAVLGLPPTKLRKAWF
jgi:hypothetical protein